ncbi:MAG: GatB/YqeY domain-containing protein [Flavobacteriales bacterium]
MSLTNKITADIKEAMRAREKEKLAALRAIKSALMLEATKDGSGEVSEETGMKILQKLHKQRKDAAALYKEQGREDLLHDEVFQADIIEAYLPAQMSEEEIAVVVKEIIAQTGASSPADMGKVMGAAMGRLSGKADGKLISKLVKENLSS